MIYLDITSIEFLKNFPHLKDDVESACIELKTNIALARPYYTSKNAGIEIENDSGEQIFISTPRKKNSISELVFDLIN